MISILSLCTKYISIICPRAGTRKHERVAERMSLTLAQECRRLKISCVTICHRPVLRAWHDVSLHLRSPVVMVGWESRSVESGLREGFALQTSWPCVPPGWCAGAAEQRNTPLNVCRLLILLPPYAHIYKHAQTHALRAIAAICKSPEEQQLWESPVSTIESLRSLLRGWLWPRVHANADLKMKWSWSQYRSICCFVPRCHKSTPVCINARRQVRWHGRKP